MMSHRFLKCDVMSAHTSLHSSWDHCFPFFYFFIYIYIFFLFPLNIRRLHSSIFIFLSFRFLSFSFIFNFFFFICSSLIFCFFFWLYCLLVCLFRFHSSLFYTSVPCPLSSTKSHDLTHKELWLTSLPTISHPFYRHTKMPLRILRIVSNCLHFIRFSIFSFLLSLFLSPH